MAAKTNKTQSKYGLTLVFLVLIGLSVIANGTNCYGIELAAGFSAVEEGDDRLRPGASLHVGYNPFYYSTIHVYGREFGPVKEQATLVTFSRRFGLFRSKSFKAALGGVFLDEMITFDYQNSDANDSTDHHYNLGAHFAVGWEFLAPGALFMAGYWSSHVFLAGPNGGLFLATGRKQTLSFALGVYL